MAESVRTRRYLIATQKAARKYNVPVEEVRNYFNKTSECPSLYHDAVVFSHILLKNMNKRKRSDSSDGKNARGRGTSRQ